MNFGISFAPLVPEYVVWTALAVACVLAALLVLVRSRGALVRTRGRASVTGMLAMTRPGRVPMT